MKRYVIFHSVGVAFANSLREVADIVSYLECRHYMVFDTMDDVSTFTEMVHSLDSAMDFFEDLLAGSSEDFGSDADRR